MGRESQTPVQRGDHNQDDFEDDHDDLKGDYDDFKADCDAFEGDHHFEGDRDHDED